MDVANQILPPHIALDPDDVLFDLPDSIEAAHVEEDSVRAQRLPALRAGRPSGGDRALRPPRVPDDLKDILARPRGHHRLGRFSCYPTEVGAGRCQRFRVVMQRDRLPQCGKSIALMRLLQNGLIERN